MTKLNVLQLIKNKEKKAELRKQAAIYNVRIGKHIA